MTEAPRPPADEPGDGTPGAPPPPPSYEPPPPPPPGGGYPPPGGYAAGPPPGYPSADDKTWALLAHFGGAVGAFVLLGVGGWIAPLIALLAKGNMSPTVRAHAVTALNFQITWSIVGVIGYALVCVLIGWVAVLGAAAMGVVFGIMAGMKANEGQLYRYPASLNLVK